MTHVAQRWNWSPEEVGAEPCYQFDRQGNQVGQVYPGHLLRKSKQNKAWRYCKRCRTTWEVVWIRRGEVGNARQRFC